MAMAAIYARVSSARQKEEHTIDSQTAALRAHAAATGLAIPPDWVFEDDGYSGATLIRPALERLRDLAAEIEIPVVLCYAPDRLARRYVYQTVLIEELARVGTEVRFLKGRKAETPEDELLLQFQGMIAEYERAQIAERTRRGKLHRARSGSPAVLSGAPYGYRYVRKSEQADACYEIVESEAAVVRELFRRYVEEQASIGALARWLRVQAIPTTTGKAGWDRSTLWGMLRNPAYCGRAAFGKTRQSDERPKITRPVRRRGARRSRAHPRRARAPSARAAGRQPDDRAEGAAGARAAASRARPASPRGGLSRGAAPVGGAPPPLARAATQGGDAPCSARRARGAGRRPRDGPPARGEPREVPGASASSRTDILHSRAPAGCAPARPRGARRTGARHHPPLDSRLKGRSRPWLSFAWEES